MAAVSSVGSRRAYEVIEENLNIVRSSQDPERIFQAYINLGIHPEDIDAQTTMSKKIIEVLDPNVFFIPSSADPGIYFVYNLSEYSDSEKEAVLKEIRAGLSKKKPSESIEPTAVFKIGAQRAQMELIARKIAYITGLGPYAIGGCFFSLKNPDLSPWGGDFAFEETLWNGATKEYNSKQDNQNARAVGILEPFLKRGSHSKQKKKELFAMIVTLAMVIGWRDGKECNKEDALTDLEECMPRMLTPTYDVSGRITPDEFLKIQSQGSCVAATHLPFLEVEGLTEEPMNKKDALKLASIVSRWDIKKIVEEIAKEKIQYPDTICETVDPTDEADMEIQDENFCTVNLLLNEIVNEDALYAPKFLSGETPALDEDQLKAFEMRLKRIKEVLELKKDKITPADIVQHVDPFYWRHLELVKIGKEICERKRTLSSSQSLGKSPAVYSYSPVSTFISRSFSQPGRGPVPTGIMSASLNSSGAKAQFMSSVVDLMGGSS